MNIQPNGQDEQRIREIWESYLEVAEENHNKYKKGVIAESEYILTQAEYVKQTIQNLGQFMFDLIARS